MAAEGEQARLVARDERLVGGLVAASGQRDEALVGLQPQERRGPTEAVGAGGSECGCFHADDRTNTAGMPWLRCSKGSGTARPALDG